MDSSFVLGLKASSTYPTRVKSLLWQARGGRVKNGYASGCFSAAASPREEARLGALGVGGCNKAILSISLLEK